MCQKWKKIETGRYMSDDGRFTVRKKWDRLYGNHWLLTDQSEIERMKRLLSGMDLYMAIPKAEYPCRTLGEAKDKAYTIAMS